MRITITDEEKLVLEPILESLNKRTKPTHTLYSLLTKWEEFVISVERGYRFSIYDYTNDLSVRDILQRIIDQCPLALRHKICSAINTYDEQFKTITIEKSEPIYKLKADPSFWWWYRVPKYPGAELQNDLDMD